MMKKRITAILTAGIMALGMVACGSGSGNNSKSNKSSKSGVEDGVLSVAMECSYAPYNWAQPNDSNNSVPIKDSDQFANGYDIMMAQKICKANGWKLEVHQLDWDSLIPAVQSGTIDAVIAGQSMTKEREKQVDFAGPYLYADIVVLTTEKSKYASATGISGLAGGKCTSQLGTVWYNSCLPQIKDAKIQEASESAPAMLMALETGAVDYVVTDMPTAQGALQAYPNMKILDFTKTDDNFKTSDEDINIGISVKKGNTILKNAINKALKGMTAEDFNKVMADATNIQPISKK